MTNFLLETQTVAVQGVRTLAAAREILAVLSAYLLDIHQHNIVQLST